MFTIDTETTIHLRKFSKREENHGKDLIPAIDLAVEQSGPATLLDLFHKDLRASIFTNRGAPPPGELDLPIGDTPNIKVPMLKMPLSLDYEQTGLSLRVFYGSNEKSHVVLGLVKMHKVQIVERAEGGSVKLHYSLSCANEISEKVIGRLGILGGHDISITLEAPHVEEAPAPPALTVDDVFGEPPEPTPEQALIDTEEQPSET